MTETLAILVADVIIYCGLYYLTMQLSESASWILFILIVSVNVTFVVYWLFTLIRSAWDPITTSIPILRRILRPNYFSDEDIEKFLERLSWDSPTVASYHFTLQKSMRATLKTSLPSQFLRQAKRYVPRVSAVVVSMTTERLEARRMFSEFP